MTTWNIESSVSGPGQIVPSGTTLVPDGDSQDYTMAEDPGKNFVDVLVDGVSQGPIGAYTFVNVTEPHTIEAMFSESPPAPGITAEAVWEGAKAMLVPPLFQNLDSRPKLAVETIILTWADVIVETWKAGTTNLGHPCVPPGPSTHPATVLPTDWVIPDMVQSAFDMFQDGKWKDPLAPEWDIGPLTIPGAQGNLMRWTQLTFTSFVNNLTLITSALIPDGCIPHSHFWETSAFAPVMYDAIRQGIPSVFQPYAPRPEFDMIALAFCTGLQDEIAKNGGTTLAMGPAHFHTLV